MNAYTVNVLYPICAPEEWIYILMGARRAGSYKLVASLTIYAESVDNMLEGVYSLLNSGEIDVPRRMCVGDVVMTPEGAFICSPGDWEPWSTE